ncbi:hypothetical protein [Holophaga foetida]|uniref:hypothetical protein n=1 Tax=Holophaga foetida TaxID=35839 RepID=UPI0002473B50|nr:hypothetical protein [Holophaga foetida]
MQTPKNQEQRGNAGNHSTPDPVFVELSRQADAMAAELLDQARSAAPGGWFEGCLSIFPLCVVAADFDGEGGILINPLPTFASDLSYPLLNELRRQGGTRVRLGWWRDGKADLLTLEDIEKMETKRAEKVTQ